MATKPLFFYVLLAVAALSAGAGGASPVINITSAVTGNTSPPISIQFKAGGSLKGSAQLGPSQSYQIDVDVNDAVYYASAVFGLRFAAFHAYEPARDTSRAVYWRANNDGFALSYDHTIWKEVALWESE